MALKILIIDDSPVLRIMLQEMLESLGHEVVGTADSGEGGLKAFKELKPDLTTLDISLPDKNGLEVLQLMRRTDPTAKVLVVTGNDQKTLEDQAARLKALGVLHKPFDEEELSAFLQKAGA